MNRTAAAAVLTLAAGLGLTVPASASASAATHHLHHLDVVPAVTTGQENDLITDAPTAVHVGATAMTIPVTVGSDLDLTSSEIGLYPPGAQDNTDPVVSDADFPGRAVRSFRFRLTLYSDEVRRYGAYQWYVSADDSQGVFHEAIVDAEIKAHSLLGATATRSGSRVRFTVSARVWNTTARRYSAYPTGVYLQKQASDGSWASVGGATLGSTGNGVVEVLGGAGVYRLYDHVTATVWSAITPALRVR